LKSAAAAFDPEISQCAGFKLVFLRLKSRDPTLAGIRFPPHFRNGLRQTHQYSGTTKIEQKIRISAGRYLATYTDTSGFQSKVIVEIKRPTGNYQDYKTGCEKIASLLAMSPKPEHLRAPHCLGLIFDQCDSDFSLDRPLSFIFRHPVSYHKHLVPSSLAGLLTPGPKHLRKPGLGTRFSLAFSLATSVLLLQACELHHKSLEPRNILFFSERDGTINLKEPRLFGFDHAGPHGLEFTSSPTGLQRPSKRARVIPPPCREAMIAHVHQMATQGEEEYQFHVHPVCPQNSSASGSPQRYLKRFDIYSLGVMLYEIAVWKNLLSIELVESAVAANFPDVKRAHVRDALLGSLQQMAPDMGHIYTSVIARCLTGDIENGGAPTRPVRVPLSNEYESDEILQGSFKRNIVDQLALCKA